MRYISTISHGSSRHDDGNINSGFSLFHLDLNSYMNPSKRKITTTASHSSGLSYLGTRLLTMIFKAWPPRNTLPLLLPSQGLILGDLNKLDAWILLKPNPTPNPDAKHDYLVLQSPKP